jgi:hypothetical protein
MICDISLRCNLRVIFEPNHLYLSLEKRGFLPKIFSTNRRSFTTRNKTLQCFLLDRQGALGIPSYEEGSVDLPKLCKMFNYHFLQLSNDGFLPLTCFRFLIKCFHGEVCDATLATKV